jgi:hypothetical protein
MQRILVIFASCWGLVPWWKKNEPPRQQDRLLLFCADPQRLVLSQDLSDPMTNDQ